VTATDGTTADYFPFPLEILGRTATRIINEVRGHRSGRLRDPLAQSNRSDRSLRLFREHVANLQAAGNFALDRVAQHFRPVPLGRGGSLFELETQFMLQPERDSF
jgi:hypothetical protein